MNAPTSLSNTLDERGWRKHRQVRIYSILGAVVTCMAVILVGVLVLILVLQQQDRSIDRESAAEEVRVAEYWAGICRNAVVATIAAAYCVTGFVRGHISTLPPINGTPQERVEGQYFHQFHLLADMLNFTDHNIGLVATVPGGVVYQTVPNVASLHMYDLLYNYTPPLLGTADPWIGVRQGAMTIVGPRRRRIPGLGGRVRWDIDVMQPVHNASENANQSEANFWGFTYTILSLTALLEEEKMVSFFAKEGLDFLMYYTTADDLIVPVFSSVPELQTQEQLRSLIDQGTSHNILASMLNWFIAVHRNRGHKRLSHRNIAITVGTTVSCSVALLIVAIAVILYCTQEYDGRRYAPKRPPFAIVTLGPVHGDELWHLASDQMVEVTERLNALLARAMAARHAYPTVQLHPFTSSYVTRTVGAAVRMSFDVLEELQSHPIDAPLRRLLGDDGRLLLSCAVHWCTEATISAEPGGGGYRFEGLDVMLGGRMWFFAAPNTVTLSSAAHDARMGDELHGTHVEAFNSVYLRGVKQRQHLFVITDPSSRRLREAAAVANERLARFREAQRRLQQEKAHRSLSEDAGGQQGGVAAGDSSMRGAPDFLHSPWTSSFTSMTDTSPAGGQEASLSGSASAASLIEMEAAAGRVMLRRPRAASAARAVVDGTTPGASAGAGGGGGNHSGDPSHMMTTAAAAAAAVSVPRAPSSSASSADTDVIVPSAAAAAAAVFGRVEDGHPLALPEESSGGGGAVGLAVTGARAAGRGSRPAPTLVRPYSLAVIPALNPLQQPPPSFSLGHGVETRGSLVEAVQRADLCVLYKPDSPLAVESSGAAAVNTATTIMMTAAATATPAAGSPSSSSSSLLADGLAADGGLLVSLHHLRLSRLLGNRAGERRSTAHNTPLLVEVPAGPNPLVPPRTDPALSVTGGGGGGGGGLLVPASAPGSDVAAASASELSLPGGTHAGGVGRVLAGDSVAPSPRLPAVFDDGPLGGGAGAGGPGRLSGPTGGTPAANSILRSPSEPSGGAAAAGSTDGNGDDGPASDPEAIQRALLHPSYPVYVDTALRSAYEHQAVGMDISYDSVRVPVYYFFSSLKLLFRPLSAQERRSIYGRLTAAFGVPQQGALEHLAARCVTQFMQQYEETKALLWEPHGPPDTVERRKLRREKKKSA